LASQTQPARKRISIERYLDAALEDVWELWTTRDGIESWWGPDGFQVKVRSLDLRPGGELVYAMTAIAPDQIEFLKKAGMPLTTETRGRYTEVVPFKRLAFTQLADFIPNVSPYEVLTTVDFENTAHGIRMVLTLDAMHDESWTRMAVMGWESQLTNLAGQLKAARVVRPDQDGPKRES
jgi:uncharacterized protein YndB with AHSA1/START domain